MKTIYVVLQRYRFGYTSVRSVHDVKANARKALKEALKEMGTGETDLIGANIEVKEIE